METSRQNSGVLVLIPTRNGDLGVGGRKNKRAGTGLLKSKDGPIQGRDLRWSSGRKKSRAGNREGGRDGETELLQSRPMQEGVPEWLGARSRNRC